MTELPEITDVQRLSLQPGDVLVLTVQGRITQDTANNLMDVLRARLGADIPVVVLNSGMRLAVVNRAELEAQR